MAKYIELIDKYLIEQNSDGGYNPPSYIWTDNTGSITRCEICIRTAKHNPIGLDSKICR